MFSEDTWNQTKETTRLSVSLDGLLHHETGLNIEEHYSDKAGYTEQIFGLTHL